MLLFDRKLIKIAGQYIVDSLLYSINDSLLHVTYPDEWELARVTPIFKQWRRECYVQLPPHFCYGAYSKDGGAIGAIPAR